MNTQDFIESICSEPQPAEPERLDRQAFLRHAAVATLDAPEAVQCFVAGQALKHVEAAESIPLGDADRLVSDWIDAATAVQREAVSASSSPAWIGAFRG